MLPQRTTIAHSAARGDYAEVEKLVSEQVGATRAACSMHAGARGCRHQAAACRASCGSHACAVACALQLSGLCRDGAWLKSYAVATLLLTKESLQVRRAVACMLGLQLHVCSSSSSSMRQP